MAKEVVPPDPIPVGFDNINMREDFRCASITDAALGSASDVSKELIDYLEESFTSSSFGGDMRLYRSEDTDKSKVREDIINAGIKGITRHNIDGHIMFISDDDGTILIASVY